MAAGEASVDICSLLGLELVCVVPVDFPCWQARVWLEGWRAEWIVLITSGKQQSVAEGGGPGVHRHKARE